MYILWKLFFVICSKWVIQNAQFAPGLGLFEQICWLEEVLVSPSVLTERQSAAGGDVQDIPLRLLRGLEVMNGVALAADLPGHGAVVVEIGCHI